MNSLGIKIQPGRNKHPDAILVINNLEYSHKNSYTCIVNNKYTEDETSVIVTLRG